MFKLSQRLSGLEESVTLAITAKARALKAEGKDVVGFGAGEPDFDTPENIKEAAIKAIRDGQTKYTAVGGINELKDAIIGKFRRDNALTYGRDEVIVSCGGKHSIFNLFQAVLNIGDEVIIPAPYWVSYPVMVALGGGTPRVVHTKEADGFRMSPEAFKASIGPNTKAVVINSPSNPTGAAYTEKELLELAEIALENGLLIISDEIYEKLTYDGFKATSIASISDEVKKSTVVLNGVSKTYSMTGWRIGYAAGAKEIIKAMTNIQSQSTSNPTSISQWAAVEAISGPQDAIAMMVREFGKRRDAMVAGLNAINGISAITPQGAFYVFANVSGLFGRSYNGKMIKGSVDLATYLIDEAGIAVVPGEPFGDDNFVRLSYATSMENILKGVKRIGEAAGALK
ncbi:MAG TPA: aspartate aminotransferase [Deltaproteobacteria bacterium]|nr:MAG: aspartate aminotransferase [Deltaproteobacteria bacterium GWA2_55_82]OGQ62713.1 MAG: aspartate aminotransferase [Deltaproteobacteria bacterium RIFCSPLOWO2_02_FULL_55_12]OIJ74306.1 MAG: aspartate aminotransferase [Deltaproteobacteria bacterium GWC2_55_46]HBG46945.1 aspartate aminotransferase [Deltaproteobacteria bacterium]HCY10997.1 aspartate aminotransferase [Deltaproteobacteria bacterium]